MAFNASAVLVALAVSGVPASIDSANSARAAAAPTEQSMASPVVRVAPAERWQMDTPQARPAALPLLYASLGALQVADVLSTNRALAGGATEANPVMRDAAGNTGAALAIKALSTAGTIYFAERAWKKNRKGAIVLMVAINAVTAAVAAHNLRVASR